MYRLFETNNIRKYEELARGWVMDINGKSYNVTCPKAWETIPELYTYRGQAVFTKTLDIKEDTNLDIVFKGVSHTADVYFDDKFIVHHYNAFTEFSAIIPQVKAGKHILRVEVDNSFSEASALHLPNDYYSYGGITRPVIVNYVADCYIKSAQFVPKYDNGWKLNVKYLIKNLSKTDKDVAIALDIDGRKYAFSGIANAESISEITDTISVDDVLCWDIDTPNLYLADSVLSVNGSVCDDLIERIGFRTVEIKENRIYINGKQIYIKGYNRHEDHPHYGCAIPVEAMEYDLDLFRDLGANSVRTCHYPNDERFLDLCDERGFYVWEENHARGIGVEGMMNPNFQPQCLDCIREMIPAHINHPSIYIWGILNECGSESDYGRECYAQQYALIKEFDTSRPLTSATCRLFNDICLDLPDVVSINLYPMWYSDESPSDKLDRVYDWVNTTEGKGKPIILSEFGAGAIYGYHSHLREKWSEEGQCDILNKQINDMVFKDFVSGFYIWQFCDCRVTPETWFKTRPKTQNNKGVVDMYRRPKLSYDLLKKLFNEI